MTIYYLRRNLGVGCYISSYFFTKRNNAESRVKWLKNKYNQDWFVCEMKQDKFEKRYDKLDYYDYSLPEDLGDQL